jgi:predicted DsbA family dithiol-disulfide isomerase
VGLRRLTAQRNAIGSATTLRVRSWPLELVNGTPPGVDEVAEEIEALRAQVAPDLFIGFDPSQWPTTSVPALALAAAATRHGDELGERVSLALRDALFEQGRDVSDPGVLADLAAGHGLPLAADGDRDAVVADWAEGRARGVEGSPHFFLGDRSFFCPTLEITRIDDRLEVTLDASRFEQFLAVALPDDGPATSS